MADIIQIRRDTAANWTAANPVLAQGEFGVETDTLKLKIGDGASPWTGLRYYHSGSPYEAGEGISINDFTINNTGIITIGTGGTNGTIKANGQDVAVKGLGSAAYVDTTTLPNKDLDNLSTTGKANISAQGTFDGAVNYAVGTVGRRLASRASRDMTDLTATGKNIGNWSSNVTNCITEIPQDIKLELNSGTLTLKAGSKVYKPNGSGVFDTIDFSVNKTITNTTNGTYLICATTSGMIQRDISRCVSGATRPLTTTYMLWYDTTNNVVNNYGSDSATPAQTVSLPIAIITVSGGAISSIDQVFNGIGYIGSTVFALPGVKGLIPNGRNTDGTLNNTAWEVNSVLTTSFSSNIVIGMRGNALGVSGSYIYDEEKNQNLNSGSYWNVTVIGKTLNDGTIVLKNKTFHAVDYSDTEYMANQAGPSNRYVDLTLGASGANYTAPADGYVCLVKNANDTERITIRNLTTNFESSSYASANQNLGVFLPVSKNDSYTVIYNASGSTQYFRFIYANGAK